MASESQATINRLKKVFSSFNMNQSEFGDLCNISQSYLSKIMRGKQAMSRKVLEALFEQKINIQWVLTGKGDMLIFSIRERKEQYANEDPLEEFKDNLIVSLKKQETELKTKLESNHYIITDLQNTLDQANKTK